MKCLLFPNSSYEGEQKASFPSTKKLFSFRWRNPLHFGLLLMTQWLQRGNFLTRYLFEETNSWKRNSSASEGRSSLQQSSAADQWLSFFELYTCQDLTESQQLQTGFICETNHLNKRKKTLWRTTYIKTETTATKHLKMTPTLVKNNKLFENNKISQVDRLISTNTWPWGSHPLPFWFTVFWVWCQAVVSFCAWEIWRKKTTLKGKITQKRRRELCWRLGPHPMARFVICRIPCFAFGDVSWWEELGYGRRVPIEGFKIRSLLFA